MFHVWMLCDVSLLLQIVDDCARRSEVFQSGVKSQ